MNMAWIKKVYLYLVSLVSLIILIIASIMLINMTLKTWVFPKADNDYYATHCSKEIAPPAPEGQSTIGEPIMCETDELIADRRAAQKQRDAAQALAMIIVAIPVFLYHWKLARKEA